ncbi:MAG: hypothetical protein IPI46_05155 [Bacteroidetes bacterium]|nr:hypothetical protein [Bacteroidota bacterium]
MKKILITGLLSAIAIVSFAQTSKSPNAKKDFGKNIIAFHPVHLIASDFVGVGFSYERLANDYLGIKIPVMVGINNNYVNIGLEAKLYPTKNTGAVKYAIAPTLMVGIGTRQYESWVYNPNGPSTYKMVTEDATHFGFLLNQTLNVTITRQFYIGLDGGIGINYYDQLAKNNGNNTNLSFLAQMNIGLGYRF